MENHKRPLTNDTGPGKDPTKVKQFEKDNEPNSNPNLGGLTGFSLAEIIGKGAGKLVFGKSEGRPQVEKWMAKTKDENNLDTSNANLSKISSVGKRLLCAIKRLGNSCLNLFSAMIRNQNVKSYYL